MLSLSLVTFFPMCMRALRMVVEVRFRPITDDLTVQKYNTFMARRALKARYTNFGYIALSNLIMA